MQMTPQILSITQDLFEAATKGGLSPVLLADFADYPASQAAVYAVQCSHGAPLQAAGWSETGHQTQRSAMQNTAVQNTAVQNTAVLRRFVIALPASCVRPEPPDATWRDLCQALKSQTQQGLGLAGQPMLQPVRCLQPPMQPLDPI